jgi:hypothetical protein
MRGGEVKYEFLNFTVRRENALKADIILGSGNKGQL